MKKLIPIRAFAACCLLIFLTGFFYYPKWKQQAAEATLSWDVSGYYLYLPATFIYQDLRKCRFMDTILKNYQPTPDFQQAFLHSSGNYVIKYWMGQSILYSPFFLTGHLFALITSNPADGFSFPYQIAIGIGMLLYAFIGLFVLTRVLMRYFSSAAVSLVILSIVFATNYLNYAAIDGAMTHNTLFMMYALLLDFTDRYYRKPSLSLAICVGITAGLIILIRPTELICLSIPTFWLIGSFGELVQRARFFKKNINHIIVLTLSVVLLISIQLVYWKWATGKWIVDTYPNEGFDWFHPHLISGTFSYKGGWLIYTPILVLAFIGFLFLFQHNRGLFWVSFCFTGIFVYICFAWQSWWYGASLGQRSLIQAYPMLSIPLAAFYSSILQKRLYAISAVVFLVICSLYNLWLTKEAHRGGLFRGGEMTGAYLWAILGRSEVPAQYQALLDNPEQYGGDTTQYQKLFELTETKEITLDKDTQWSEQYFFKAGENSKWVRAKAMIQTPQKEWDIWKMPQFIIRFFKDSTIIKMNYLRISRIVNDGEAKMVFLDAKIPKESFDKVSVLFWDAGSDKKLYVKNLSVVGFDK